MSLPKQLPWDRASSIWKQQLDPVLANPMNGMSILKRITLVSGFNSINHLLGAPLQGWLPIRYHGSYAELYDMQDTNPTPQLTLELNASAPVTITLAVF
jgi:hypothetical protein